jgi:hypothetical protein
VCVCVCVCVIFLSSKEEGDSWVRLSSLRGAMIGDFLFYVELKC